MAIVRLLLIVLVLAAIALVLSRSGPSSAEDLRDVVGGHWWGPVIFVSIAATLVVLGVPGTFGTLAAGVLYGPMYGSMIAVVSASFGATAAFLVSRRLGRSSVEALHNPRSRAIDARLARSGSRGLLVLRILPIVPFNVLNYAAGLSGISTRSFVAGTVVGIIPGTIALTVLGSSAQEPTSPVFVSVVAVVVALSLTSVVVSRRFARRDVAACGSRSPG